jgi:hypothetical protein
MAWEIVIDFTLGADHLSDIRRIQDIGRVRDFGEVLYREFRDDKWASISLNEVDRATDQLRVSVHSARRVRRIGQTINKLLKRHRLNEIARLTEANQPE